MKSEPPQMDRPEYDLELEAAQGSAPSSSQPPTATGKSTMLLWLLGGAVSLLILYGNSDGATN